MPAQSQQQQKLFGLALAFKRGEVPASEVSDEIKAIADRMSEKEIEDFASTKHKGLPKMKEQLRKIVREIMREKVISEMNEAENPCWKGYEQIGMKMKDGKEVPNCVPKNESVNEGRVEKEVLQKISKFESLLGYITNDDQYKPLVSKVKKEIDKLKKQIKKNESVNEAASKEAMGIAALTGTRGSAVEEFINKHELDGGKLFRSIKKANLRGRLNFVSALAGKDGNPNQKLTIKLHKKNESVNESQVVNKKTGKDITRHVLDLLSGKIDKKKFEKLTGLKKESVNEGASTEEKRIVMMAIKKIAKYRNVPLNYAVGDVIRAAEELERDIQKGKVK